MKPHLKKVEGLSEISTSGNTFCKERSFSRNVVPLKNHIDHDTLLSLTSI